MSTSSVLQSGSTQIGRILISNDDGIDAVGIHILEEIASAFSDDVWVIAPMDNRSGMSRAISLRKDVIIEPHGNNGLPVQAHQVTV